MYCIYIGRRLRRNLYALGAAHVYLPRGPQTTHGTPFANSRPFLQLPDKIKLSPTVFFFGMDHSSGRGEKEEAARDVAEFANERRIYLGRSGDKKYLRLLEIRRRMLYLLFREINDFGPRGEW